jgi:hypothetical protein
MPAATVLSPDLWSATKLESTVRGVKLGLITGSIGGGGRGGRGGPGGGSGGRGAAPPPPAVPTASGAPGRDPVDVLIEQCIATGAANIEYSGPAIEKPRLLDGVIGQPPPVLTDDYRKSREEVRKWILTAPLRPFEDARKKFDASGLNWFSGVNTIAEDCTDEEIDALFRQMAAMKVKMFCTNQTRLAIAPRMAPFAAKYKIMPAFHTHDKSEDLNEVASAASLVKLLGVSPHFMVNLDIGHFTAGNQDAVAFIKEHHSRITHLHIKDRKKDHGPNVAWGTGDTPIKECLQTVRDGKYPIYAIIEREYRGPNDGTPVEETRKCMDFMRQALLS